MTSVDKNFIIANYGSSQGFDTDDGSSWYWIHDNFFFDADATKMDYGGHDNIFSDNLIYVRQGDGQNCLNQGSYLPGHGLEYSRNKCILPFSKTIGHCSGCNCSGDLAGPGRNPDGSPRTVCGKELCAPAIGSSTFPRSHYIRIGTQASMPTIIIISASIKT